MAKQDRSKKSRSTTAPKVIASPRQTTSSAEEVELIREDIEELERIAAGDAVGESRRMMLTIVRASMDALAKIRKDMPDDFSAMQEAIQAFKSHAEALAEFSQVALNKLAEAERQGLGCMS